MGTRATAGTGGSYFASSGAGGASPAASADEDTLPSAAAVADAGVVVPGPSNVNPFVLAAHDPFSTFAADVDTASYDIFRRDVGYGYLPSADNVRLEDFVNYFTYDYPAPAATAEHPFQISLAAAPNPYRRATTFVRVGIQAEKPPAFEKKPASLVFLIDVSGSMQVENKLPLVQYLAKQALQVLEPDDLVSIVTYAGETSVRLPPTPVLKKGEIAAVIDGLAAGGGTNGAGGIQLAYQQAEAAFLEGGINHVVLCTDGDFNIGISDTEQLVTLIEDQRQSGVTLTALGFGSVNNDAMMERVSNAGNGIYSVITSQSQAARYAEERLLATVVHVAKDMKIQVEWNPEHVLAYRLLGYENRAIADQDFRDDVVDAGEVGAGHRVTALYEVVLAGGELPAVDGAPEALDGSPVDGEREIAAADMLLVKVRYKQPGAAQSDPAAEVSATLQPNAVAASHDAADLDLKWAVAVATFAELLRGSPYVTKAVLPQLEAVFVAQSTRDLDREELAGLFDQASALLSP